MTMSNPIPVAPSPGLSDPMDFRDALEACRAEFSTIEEKDYQLINIDITARCTLVLGHCEKLMSLCPQVKEDLPKFDSTSFETLEAKTKSALQAHFDHLLANAKPGEIPELDAKLSRFRNLFVSDINGLANRGLIDNTKLPDLKSASGHRNQAESVSALAAHLRRSWETIRTRTGVTMEEIEEAESTAQSMLIALARKDASPLAPSEAARVRRQAYTLFYRAYEQVRRAVLFLRQPYGDVEAFAPPLRTIDRKGSREDAEETGTPAAAAVGAASPSTATTQPTPIVSAATIGLPSDEPVGRG